VTDTTVELGTVEPVESAQLGQPVPVSDEQLVAMLVERARSEGLQLTGQGGLLQQLTKRVLESALEGEITDHVGYDKHDVVGRNSGNSRESSGFPSWRRPLQRHETSRSAPVLAQRRPGPTFRPTGWCWLAGPGPGPDAPAGMNEITGVVAADLEDKGWTVRIVEIAPRMSRLLATDTATGAFCELDILKEIFHKPPTQTESGPPLSRDDAVGLKVRALHDCGFPRDVIDVFSARELYTITELERLGGAARRRVRP
jgi:hypothetical protein